MQTKKGQKGFSLVELLIVVAIIGIIAATYGNGVYVNLSTLASQKLIDGAIANATTSAPKSGYTFLVSNPSNSGYVSGAAPVNANVGSRLFTSTEAGIIYADQAGSTTTPPAATQGTPIGN